MEIIFPETTNLFFGWQNKTQLEFPIRYSKVDEKVHQKYSSYNLL